MDKVIVFIDGSNLYHGMKRARVNFDILKLAQFLAANRKFVRCYYYGSFNPFDTISLGRHRSFVRSLNLQGVVTNIKPLRIHEGRKVEKGADVHLAVDLVTFALQGYYDCAILISGDEDFFIAVDTVKQAGKIIEIAYFSNQIAEALRLRADTFHDLNKVYSEILRSNNRKV